MFDFIKKIFGGTSKNSSDFDLSFAYFQNLNVSINTQAKIVLDLLRSLSKNTSKSEADILLSELKKLRIASNTNSVFSFYFPIISHILYFKPEYANELLHHLVGPIFANGDGEETSQEMIRKIQGSMDFKLKENPNFLTKEGQLWVTEILPRMEKEIQQEIDTCKKELEG